MSSVQVSNVRDASPRVGCARRIVQVVGQRVDHLLYVLASLVLLTVLSNPGDAEPTGTSTEWVSDSLSALPPAPATLSKSTT